MANKKLEALIVLGNEMNDIMALKPKVDVSQKVDKLESNIKKEMVEINATDFNIKNEFGCFSREAVSTLCKLGCKEAKSHQTKTLEKEKTMTAKKKASSKKTPVAEKEVKEKKAPVAQKEVTKKEPKTPKAEKAPKEPKVNAFEAPVAELHAELVELGILNETCLPKRANESTLNGLKTIKTVLKAVGGDQEKCRIALLRGYVMSVNSKPTTAE